MRETVISIVIGSLGTAIEGLVEKLEGLEIRGGGDHSNYRIVEITQNTMKSTGDLRRLEETCCHANSL